MKTNWPSNWRRWGAERDELAVPERVWQRMAEQLAAGHEGRSPRVGVGRRGAAPQRAPDTLNARANLAASYAEAGRTLEAIALEEKVLADRERILGHDHPLTTRNNLATSCADAGRTSEAITLQEKVLADREHLLGHNHPDTLLARNNLAVLQWEAGLQDS